MERSRYVPSKCESWLRPPNLVDSEQPVYPEFPENGGKGDGFNLIDPIEPVTYTSPLANLNAREPVLQCHPVAAVPSTGTYINILFFRGEGQTVHPVRVKLPGYNRSKIGTGLTKSTTKL